MNDRARTKVKLPSLAFILLIHALAVAAFWHVSKAAITAAVVLHVLAIWCGISICVHRLFSHGSFKLRPWAMRVFATFGTLAGQGTHAGWTGLHVYHHARADTDDDPISPRRGTGTGFFYSHVGWIFMTAGLKAYDSYAPAIVKSDPFVRALDRWYWPIQFGQAAALYAIGGLPLFLWAYAFRLMLGWHATWFVNSATHIWGNRPYRLKNAAGNLWWVNILSGGEGWHNNHHAKPNKANHGDTKWSFDPAWWIILLLGALGIAYDIRTRLYIR